MTGSTQHHQGIGAGSAAGTGLVSPIWKYGFFVLGMGLVLAIGVRSGPSAASAGEQSGGRDGGVLSIGGFDAWDGEAVFVIVDHEGRRVGVLPMRGGSGAD